jgi:hypothetical protein
MKYLITFLLMAAPALAQSEFPSALTMTQTVSVPLMVQPPPVPATRWGIVASVGTAAGLGYHLPYTAIGLNVEKTVGPRAEVQVNGDFSPTNKYVTNNGHTVHAGVRGLWWLTSQWAVTGADSEGLLYTSQFTKHANSPAVGLAARAYWLGFPNRFYVSYLIPTGARPTDGSLQSNRVQGIRFEEEGQGWSRARLGFQLEILSFLSQSGSAPSPRSWTGTFTVKVRYGTKQDDTRLW